ncbi:MAG: lysophospholipase [Christensenellaceae bacterium]|jgi:alpha-beta hydrolase superfamily lysophospholipase|nr:lysophospholipase [Christensenellaceae bacterium]
MEIVIVLAAVLGGLLAMYVLLGYIIFVAVFVRQKHGPKPAKGKLAERLMGEGVETFHSYRAEATARFSKVECEEVRLKSAEGFDLYGRIYGSKNLTAPVIICVHGYHGEFFADFAPISEKFLKEGYSVIAVDNRGHGKSGSRYIGMGCKDAEDVLKWVAYAETKFPDAPLFLYGISMGGATVCTVSANAPEIVKGIISDCGFQSIKEVMSSIVKRIVKLPPAIVFLPMAEFFCRRINKFGFSEPSAIVSVKNATVPMLFIHGTADTFVTPDNGTALFDACGSAKKELFEIKDAGHAQAYYHDSETYFEKVCEFISKAE